MAKGKREWTKAKFERYMKEGRGVLANDLEAIIVLIMESIISETNLFIIIDKHLRGSANG